MLRQSSIRTKLALILWSTALLAFVVAIVAVPVFENSTLKHRAQQTLEPYAQLVSVGTEAAVSFGDAERAKEILNSLRANSQIVAAQITLENGALLASYALQSNAAVRPFPAKPDGVYLNGNSAELVRRLHGGARLQLVLNLAELKRLPQLTLWAFGLGLLVLLGITSVLLMTLQRTIVTPITALAEATEHIRARADYARRVPATGTDEVARLGQSFNAMMQAIHERTNELRQLNLFHQAILNNAAYAIVSADPGGTITSFNPAAERLLGYEAKDVVGKQTPVIWHDADELARHARALSEKLGASIAPGFEVFAIPAREGVATESEWTYIRKDGTRVPVLLSVSSLRDEHGQITGYVGLTYDLTERKRSQESLRKLNAELELRVQARTADLLAKSAEIQDSQRALMNLVEDLNEKAAALELANNDLAAVNKELETFCYSVSHDLRAPLRAIDGFSRILLEDYKDKLDVDGRDSLHRVCAASQRMGHLIDDLLALSRITRSEMRRCTVYLSDIATQIAAELQQTEPDRNVEFQIEPALKAEGDPILLRAVLENLLGNAWKFTGKQPSARIEFGITERHDTRAFYVRDNGAGFDMAYANKLFGAFQRLHAMNDFPGTGIGLATVQRIVHRHGGWVEAEGAVKRGAAFYFTLPETSSEARGVALNGAKVTSTPSATSDAPS